jgi:glycosidase
VYCPLNGLPDYAQEDPTVAAYLTALSCAWVQRVMPDGIRMDTAHNVLTSYFAQSFVPGVRGVRSDLFLVAEYFDASGVASYVPTLDAGFDSAFHFPLRQALDDAFAKGGSVDEVAGAVASAQATLGAARALRLVTLLDNHDVPRFMSDAPAGLSTDEMSRRYALGLVALFTLPGIPQLYQGDELGALGVAPDNRRDMPTWAWDASTRAGAHTGYVGNGQATWALVQKLVALRGGEEALWHGDYAERLRQNGGANVFAFLRTMPATPSAAMVVLSNDGASRTLSISLGKTPPWPDGTTLVDALGLGAPSSVTVSQGSMTITLPPLTPAVYRAGP